MIKIQDSSKSNSHSSKIKIKSCLKEEFDAAYEKLSMCGTLMKYTQKEFIFTQKERSKSFFLNNIISN